MEHYLKQGLVPDSKVLDIRQVDVSTGRILKDNTPLFVITFTTQEVLLFRDRKTRDVVVGAENRIEQCNYEARTSSPEAGRSSRCALIIFVVRGWELMMVSESRWRVGRVVHIYNLVPALLITTTVDGGMTPLPPL